MLIKNKSEANGNVWQRKGGHSILILLWESLGGLGTLHSAAGKREELKESPCVLVCAAASGFLLVQVLTNQLVILMLYVALELTYIANTAPCLFATLHACISLRLFERQNPRSPSSKLGENSRTVSIRCIVITKSAACKEIYLGCRQEIAYCFLRSQALFISLIKPTV